MVNRNEIIILTCSDCGKEFICTLTCKKYYRDSCICDLCMRGEHCKTRYVTLVDKVAINL